MHPKYVAGMDTLSNKFWEYCIRTGAKAERPEEYVVPLLGGLRSADANRVNVYWRNQSGEVTMVLSGKATTGVSAGAIIAILPEGYRPTKQAIITRGTHEGIARIHVLEDGSVQYNGPQIPVDGLLWCSGSFVANEGEGNNG